MEVSTAKETAPTQESAAPAARHILSHVRFWIVGCGALWLDLWSKEWAFSHLRPREIRPFFAGLFDFRRSLNDGAVFGSFTGQTKVFIVASIFAIAFVVYLFAHSDRTQRSLHIALALILAGALGNLYDRAFVQADVVAYRSGAGEARSIIGSIESHPTEGKFYLRDWPDGDRVRSFVRADVTVRRQGVVRDFIKFVPRFPDWTPKLAGRDIWPWIFNVADAALVCGVGVLLIHTWLDRRFKRSRE